MRKGPAPKMSARKKVLEVPRRMKPTNNKYDEFIDTKRRTARQLPSRQRGRAHGTDACGHGRARAHRHAQTRAHTPPGRSAVTTTGFHVESTQPGSQRRRQAAEKQQLRFSESLAGFDAAKQARQTRSLASDGDVTTGAVLVRDLFSPCASY